MAKQLYGYGKVVVERDSLKKELEILTGLLETKKQAVNNAHGGKHQ